VRRNQATQEITMTPADPPSNDPELQRPSIGALPSYMSALERGWSPDNIRGKAAADEQLERINQDAAAFLDTLHDPQARGPRIKLPDGSTVPRLPGYTRWIWDGEFCGSIHLRWQSGTSSLPPHVLGHVGYAIVPWKRGRGYATRALALLLPDAWRQGLDYVELTTDPDNVASQKVILSNGGRFVERFRKLDVYGGTESLLFRITRS
jgi:predicted acetyltransferase